MLLSHRAVVQVSGPDAFKFLQGLISQNLSKLETPADLIYSAILSPRGRILHDAFLSRPEKDRFLIDVDASLREKLLRMLSLYRLRAQVQIEASARHSVHQCLSADGHPPDPRFASLGSRRFVEEGDAAASAAADFDYHLHRIRLGIPEGAVDFLYDQNTPLECNFDLLNGISFDKGCYTGQELTARTHHVGVVRKRLLPVSFVADADATAATRPCLPMSGADVLREGKVVGRIASVHSAGVGLALLRLEHAFAETGDGKFAMPQVPLEATCGSSSASEGVPLRVRLLPHRPEWLPWRIVARSMGGDAAGGPS